MKGYTNISKPEPVLSIAPRSRTVNVSGETPSEEFHGAIEIVHGDGKAHIHVSHASIKKYNAKARWHSKSIFLTISAEDLKHLVNL